MLEDRCSKIRKRQKELKRKKKVLLKTKKRQMAVLSSTMGIIRRDSAMMPKIAKEHSYRKKVVMKFLKRRSKQIEAQRKQQEDENDKQAS